MTLVASPPDVDILSQIYNVSLTILNEAFFNELFER